MIPAPDGYQYGAMFLDGSVAHGWNGRTSRQRAEEYIERVLARQREWIADWGSDREPDRIVLVRRRPGGEWEDAEADRRSSGDRDHHRRRTGD